MGACLPGLYAEAVDPSLYSQLKFRYIGPVGNRISAVTGVHGIPLIIYAGSASGGIFKSADGGTTWKPIFDDQPVSSIGSLAVAPSNPNIVWARTGETWIRSHISVGMGAYKSTDAGGTDADIRGQLALMQSIRDNMQAVGQMVNQLETVRKQLLDLQASQPSIRAQANALEQNLLHFEENFVQLKVTAGQNGMRWPAKLNAKLSHLATQVQETDFAATAQQIAVNQQYTAQIRSLRTRFDELIRSDIAQFNQLLKSSSLPELPAATR